MPFDDFMALAQASPKGEKRGMASGSLQELELEDSSDDRSEWDLSGFDDQVAAEGVDAFDFTVESSEEGGVDNKPENTVHNPGGDAQGAMNLGNGMDERFYLEPLDEEGSLK
jgi:hypothetical protein